MYCKYNRFNTCACVVVRVMDYDDPDDVGNTGNQCIEGDISSVNDDNVCIRTRAKVRTSALSWTIYYFAICRKHDSEHRRSHRYGSRNHVSVFSLSDDDGNFEIEILKRMD